MDQDERRFQPTLTSPSRFPHQSHQSQFVRPNQYNQQAQQFQPRPNVGQDHRQRPPQAPYHSQPQPHIQQQGQRFNHNQDQFGRNNPQQQMFRGPQQPQPRHLMQQQHNQSPTPHQIPVGIITVFSWSFFCR